MISGAIASFSVKPVKAGAYIDLVIAYSVSNPDAAPFKAYKIYLVAKDSLGNKEMVKDANVITTTFTDSGSWRLWKMPTSPITLEIRLYAHPETPSWDWDWWK